MRHSPSTPPEPSGTDRQQGQPAEDVLAGRKAVQELLETNPERIESVSVQRGAHGEGLGRILDLCRDKGVRFRLVEKRDLDRLFAGVHQGVVAQVYAPGLVELDELARLTVDAPLPVLLALDEVQDPGNVGTLARTAWALGAGGLLLPRHGSARLGGAALRASAGALTRLPVCRPANLAQSLDALEAEGFAIYCAAASTATERGTSAFALHPEFPAVLVLGSEEKGIRPGVMKRCHQRVFVPMAREFDSLNVAQAGAILLAQLAAFKGHSV